MHQTKPKFNILDGLRGIAATYVVINHCRGHLFIGGREYAAIKPIANWSVTEKLYYSFLQVTSLGREFVIFFFVLSGFSIAHSLTYTIKLSGFYQRRLIRVYPPYLTALFWAFMVFSIIHFVFPEMVNDGVSVFDNPAYIIYNFFYMPHGALIDQFWSLTYEVIFYLIIPFALFKRRVYYIVSALLFIGGWFISWNTLSNISVFPAFIIDYNIYFVMGVFLYFNYSTIEKYFLLSNRNTVIVSALLFILMVVTKFKTNEHNKITLLMAACLSIVLIINFQHKKITNKVLEWLGNMSYTIYITHIASIYLFKLILIKLHLVNSIIITNKWIWITGIFFCILTSYGIYLISERPTKILLNYFRNREKKKATTVSYLKT
jgi:peptidoglycan/LPS O-acetylase OafA/YrhL